MSVAPLEPGNAPAPVRALYAAIEGRMGQLPNLFRVLGHQPAYAEPFAGLIGAVLAGGVLPAGLKEMLILVVSQGNRSEYCTLQHARMAGVAGVPGEKLALLRAGAEADSPLFDARERALIALARALHADAHHVPAPVWAAARAACTEAEIVDAAFVACLFEGITRFADGMGVEIEAVFWPQEA